ncbi:trigger factor [Dolosicoccus paucivorans]|uniref:Trigger factor n=1 Tax=Dolosicoccus paucivorans TaxID=84521 RepID=A0A1G8KZI9_9LACT|nr:trigger factor [Dolosicoccus paucivorans]PMB85128.1 trigger factor [Dolosicoccus paucivorans]PMC58930.1 trigger factor [Dolosicoccus paucivorans]SDI48300.1 trigger factor [Dolosicoccus paucivorans]
MTTKFEKQNANEGLLTFEIPVEDTKKALDKAFNRVKGNLSVPGFRKGKVPRQIFNNIYGEEALYQDALNDVLAPAYAKAVEAEGLEVVAEPSFDIVSMEKGQPWVLTAQVVTKPEVKLGDYKNLTIEKQDREVTQEDVDNALETQRQNMADLVIKDGKAEEGDTVVIDFEGFLGDEAFEGGKGTNHSLELGSNSFIPGFEEQLVGTQAGDEVDVKVTFPEEYHAEELAGKEATFKVTVHEVKTLELPELDDEFAKDADDEVETLDELKHKLRVQLEEAKEQEAKGAAEDAALRQAVENAEIVDLPQVMVDEEIERQITHFLNNLKHQQISEELYYQLTGTSRDDLKEQFAEEADLRTKTNLVLEAIVKAENIEVSQEDMDHEISLLSAQYGMEEDQVRQFVTKDILEADIKMKKAMELIVESAEEK